MNAIPPVRLTLDKVVVRVVQLPLRRPIVAKLGEFKQLAVHPDGRAYEGRRHWP